MQQVSSYDLLHGFHATPLSTSEAKRTSTLETCRSEGHRALRLPGSRQSLPALTVRTTTEEHFLAALGRAFVLRLGNDALFPRGIGEARRGEEEGARP
jgi:hypothetical protein